MSDWPNQTYAVAETFRLIDGGARRICICGATGMGKSLIMQRIIERALADRGWNSLAYVNRTFGLEQISETLYEGGVPFGVQAPGYAPSDEPVQLASIQMVEKRWSQGKMRLHSAKLVFLDEAHSETAERMLRVLAGHYDLDAIIILLTATPVGIGHMADHLVAAGSTSEGRKYGALVPAIVYAPDEPDVRALKKTRTGIIQFMDEFKKRVLSKICGRVIEHYHRLNPEQRPALLFAPGVPESRWLCDQFNSQGIPWSHIDSNSIIINGEEMPATRETRQILRDASRTGRTKGISNRFVFREAANYPWLYHGILACSVGSVANYIQMVGRLLRAHPSLDHVIIQDHGGNWWRHDSPNADREWRLGDTDGKLRERHEEPYRTKKEPEPIVCPKCKKVRKGGRFCKCGYAEEGRRRTVIQTNGSLREVRGDVYKERRVSTSPLGHKKWVTCYFRCFKSKKGMTFNQCRAMFQWENNGAVPSAEFPLMPKYESDWSLPVRDVPVHRLTRGYEKSGGTHAAAS